MRIFMWIKLTIYANDTRILVQIGLKIEIGLKYLFRSSCAIESGNE